MRIAGHRDLAASRPVVFEAIQDPTVLLACIPGCEAVERDSPTDYRARIAIRLPGIAGSYELVVRVADAQPPATCRLEGHVQGRPGTIAGLATLELIETVGSGTRLVYVADARIEGPLAWLDTGLIERLARTILDQGLARLDQQLGRRTDAPGTMADDVETDGMGVAS